MSGSEDKVLQKPVQLFIFLPKIFMFLSLLCHFCSFVSVFFSYSVSFTIFSLEDKEKCRFRKSNSHIIDDIFSLWFNWIHSYGILFQTVSISFSIHPSVAESKWLQQDMTRQALQIVPHLLNSCSVPQRLVSLPLGCTNLSIGALGHSAQPYKYFLSFDIHTDMHFHSLSRHWENHLIVTCLQVIYIFIGKTYLL